MGELDKKWLRPEGDCQRRSVMEQAKSSTAIISLSLVFEWEIENTKRKGPILSNRALE